MPCSLIKRFAFLEHIPSFGIPKKTYAGEIFLFILKILLEFWLKNVILSVVMIRERYV